MSNRSNITAKAAKPDVAVSVIAKAFEAKVKPLLKWDGKIVNQEDFKKAEATLYKVKELLRSADKKEKEITGPIMESVKKTRELFKPFKNLVEGWEAKVKEEMTAFLNRQEKLIEKVGEDFEAGKIKKAETVFKRQENLAVERDHAKVRQIAVLRIIDLARIPREYMVPDEAAILADLKAGKKIAGVELEYQKQIAI